MVTRSAQLPRSDMRRGLEDARHRDRHFTHIHNKGEQLTRYYGYYSNVSRGKRKKEKPEEKTEISEIDAPPVSKELEKRWSYFIRKVYETDPLISMSDTWVNVNRNLLPFSSCL